MFTFFIFRSLQCEYIDTSVVFNNMVLQKGEKYCVKAKLPNLLVITNFIEKVKITYGLSSSVNEDLLTAGSLPPSPYFFFTDFATLYFEAIDDEAKLSFTAITLPEECKNNAWYSNIPLSNFTVSDTITNEIKNTVKYNAFCVFFSTNEVQEYSINADLPNSNDKIIIGEDVYQGLNVNFPFKAYRSQFFIVNLDERKNTQINRKIVIKNINKEYLKPTIPGCGYIFSETTLERHHSTNFAIYFIIILFFFIGVFLIVKKYIRGIPIDFKYENIRNS